MGKGLDVERKDLLKWDSSRSRVVSSLCVKQKNHLGEEETADEVLITTKRSEDNLRRNNYWGQFGKKNKEKGRNWLRPKGETIFRSTR